MVLSAVAARKAREATLAAEASAAQSPAPHAAAGEQEEEVGDESISDRPKKKAKVQKKREKARENKDDGEEEDSLDEAAESRIVSSILAKSGSLGSNRYFSALKANDSEESKDDEDGAMEQSFLDGSEGSEEEIEEEEGSEEEEESAPPAKAHPSFPLSTRKANLASSAAPQTDRVLSTWKASFGGSAKNCVQSSEGYTTVGLADQQTLTLLGCYEIKVLSGTVSVGGAILSANSSSHSAVIFAPKSNPLPVLKAHAGSNTVQETERSDSVLDAKKFAAVIEIHPHHASGIKGIGQACPLAGSEPFSTDFKKSAGANVLGVDGVQLVSTEERSIRGQMDMESWEDVLSHVTADIESSARAAEPPVVLISGPKRVGKSTFCRRTLHRLLSSGHHSSVAFLDLDLGQSEFGPPGMVSLHMFLHQPGSPLVIGPNWCTLRQPVRAHFVGDTSPSDAPREYMDAVFDLIDYFHEGIGDSSAEEEVKDESFLPRRRKRVQSAQENDKTALRIPLVVNTMGWVKGLGADLLAQIEEKLDATHVIQFYASDSAQAGAKPNSPPSLVPRRRPVDEVTNAPNPPARMYTVPPFDGDVSSQRLTAADTRTLCLMSYFHAQDLPAYRQVSGTASIPRWSFDEPLVAQDVFEVNLASGFPGGVHILPFRAPVSDELKLDALDCSIACIVAVDESGDANTGSASGPPSHRSSTALGLALIRYVNKDAASPSVQLLSPVKAEQLQAAVAQGQKLALVKGAIPVPVWAFLDFDLAEAARDGSIASKGDYLLGGIPLRNAPYLVLPAEQDPNKAAETSQQPIIIGAKRRKIRKNVMRKSQLNGAQAG